MQLDKAERGFSFRHDGPLDMRMGGEGPSAADLVNTATERDLADIIFKLGEERIRAPSRARSSRRAAEPIDNHARARRHRRVGRARRGRAKSIRRRARSRRCACSSTTSSANLATALAAAERMLKPGGRLVVVSFHSLEDRIVKTFLADAAEVAPARVISPKLDAARADVPHADEAPVVADDEEIAAIRARARPSCAPPSARTCRARWRCRRTCCRDLPSLADVHGGR